MWELVAANKRKSAGLFVLLGVILALTFYAFGKYYLPQTDGFVLIFFGICFWLMMSGIAYFTGDDIILAVSEATPVTRDTNPMLFDVVEEMKIAAALPGMPKIYVMNEEAMNAMAVGRDPQNSAIVVTSGLLAKLNRDELRHIMMALGDNVSPEELDEMLKDADVNGDGSIEYRKFVRLMLFK